MARDIKHYQGVNEYGHLAFLYPKSWLRTLFIDISAYQLFTLLYDRLFCFLRFYSNSSSDNESDSKESFRAWKTKLFEEMPMSNLSSPLDIPSHADFWPYSEKHCRYFWKWIDSSDLTLEVSNKCGSHMRLSDYNALFDQDLQYKCSFGACPLVCSHIQTGLFKHVH